MKDIQIRIITKACHLKWVKIHMPFLNIFNITILSILKVIPLQKNGHLTELKIVHLLGEVPLKKLGRGMFPNLPQIL